MRYLPAFLLLLLPFHSAAQTSTVVTGEASVSVEGKQATGSGEATSSGNVVQGTSSDVIIGGKPAATVGDSTDCGGVIVSGSSSVFVNGKPLATTGSAVTGCGN